MSSSMIHVAVADSDTVAVDSLQASRSDTSASDTTAVDTTYISRYLGLEKELRTQPWTGLPPPQDASNLLAQSIRRFWDFEVELDSTEDVYTAAHFVEGETVTSEVVMELPTYKEYRMEAAVNENWRELIEQRSFQQNQGQRGFGVNIDIPGAEQSAFSTIFGKPEVDLRVNGLANIDAGFTYNKSEQQASALGQGGRINPDFGQDLQLNISGTIGDKLNLDVNWDTERSFDFQNQLKLEYTGYEDEIIQRVVAGNVNLQSSSRLINSGQSLFGIRTDLQFGGLNITTVMSQQEGQSNELNIEGGSQTTTFDLRPTDYENNTHFFLSYYFRRSWEPAFQDPTQLILGPNFERITAIEVWRLKQTVADVDDERQAVALVDLAEPEAVRQGAENYSERQLPSTDLDRYTSADLDRMRDGSQAVDDFLQSNMNLEPSMYQRGKFVKLEEGTDYEFDPSLGYLSLNSALSNNQALAVAYRYVTRDGRVVEVGDFSSGGGSSGQQTADRLVLKLVHAANEQPADPSWDLMLRNIYPIPGSNINREQFNLQIQYTKPGDPAQGSLPGVIFPNRLNLLQGLGLDRLNSNQAPSPDNEFDFMPGITIDPANGRLIFPYLEPFDQRIRELINNSETQVSGRSKEEAVNAYAFPQLYEDKIQNAQRNTEHDIYRINGSYKSTVQQVYNLGGFGIVDGSVQVTSGGQQLSPGSDYTVNYSTGTVTITNPAYLTPGRDINITYEKSQMLSLQKKTLVGLRADYQLEDWLTLGGTAMRLSQQPVTDKYRIGREPMSNLIWGLDGSIDLEPRWLTQAADAIPLVQTKTPSQLSVRGEVAQLRPGHPKTVAYERTQDRLEERGRAFKPDERRGISYIDDFEGVENSFDLTSPGAWRLSTPPANEEDSTAWRGELSWYKIPRSFDYPKVQSDNQQAVRPIHINEVFPNRDIRGESIQNIQTFDVFFEPSRRGPYNYTSDLRQFQNNPQRVWGGITQRLPEGYTDFSVQNIEFVEFIFSPHSRDPSGEAANNARLVLELGTISEDVIPNDRLNTEDGLAQSDIDQGPRDDWSLFPTSIQDGVINVDRETNRTEDRGLDGLPSTTSPGNYATSERQFFSNFLSNVRQQFGEDSPEYRRAYLDPSADDYRHWSDEEFYTNDAFFPDGALLQERFSRFFSAMELNSFEGHRTIADRQGAGVTQNPDSEDLNLNGNLDTENSYYQYELPLNRSRLDQLASPTQTQDYVVSKITGEVGGQSSEWYLVRIPVSEFTDKTGNINDFTFIESIRMWTDGHEAPVTMRFATMDLVGSQWRESDQVGDPTNTNQLNTSLNIATINNEENDEYQIPNGTIRSQTRLSTGVTQNAREQSMVLDANNLAPGDERGVFRTYSEALNLLKYSNLRMFVHGHGEDFEDRNQLNVFVRLGINAADDYYEYEQPITPSSPLAGSADELWQTNQQMNGRTVDLNSVNIKLAALNQLKFERNQLGVSTDSIYQPSENYDFAPPGTRLSIKGNPSLSGIKTVIIGLRNPADSTTGDILREGIVWVNELRATGFEEEPGWASLASAQVKMADLLTINANMRGQTDGFGELSSGLGDRNQQDTRNWGLNTTFHLDQFTPERYGWSFPLNLSLRANQTMPRFSPSQGDIRVEEMLTQIEEQDDLSAAEKRRRKDEVMASARTSNVDRSVSIRASKSGSRSEIVQKTLDALSLSFNRSTSTGRSPSTRLDDSWQWSSSLDYQLRFREPHTVQPFGIFEGVWGLDWISSTPISYLPSNVGFSATANRNFRQSQDRIQGTNLFQLSPDSLRYLRASRYPMRENQNLGHRRSFTLQYDPFGFLGLNFDSNVTQNLNTFGADTTFHVITRNASYPNTTIEEATREGLADQTAVEQQRIQVNPIGEVIASIVQHPDQIRTDRYGQSLGSTYRPNASAIEALNWIEIQPISYRTQFDWNNGPIAQDSTGASVSNNVNFQGDIRFAIERLWQKFEWYRNMKQRQERREARAEYRRKQQESEEDTTGFSISLPELSTVGEQTFLFLTSMQNIRISYQRGWNSRTSNVKGSYSLMETFRGNAPSLRYRLGLDNTIPLDDRWIENQRLQVNDNLRNNTRIGAQTTFRPSREFSLDLTWDVNWSRNKSISYSQDDATGEVQEAVTTGGQNEATIWALGGDYKEFFRLQRQVYEEDVALVGPNDAIFDANEDGEIVLTNQPLINDFRDAYLRSVGTFDENGLLPIPLPNWNLTYSGFGNLPLITALTESATLNHGYSATYANDFRSSVSAGLDKTFSLGSRTVRYQAPSIVPGSIRINERFQPLIGLSMTFTGGIQTNVSWNRSRSRTLSPTNAEVRASNVEDISVNMSFSQEGMELPIPFFDIGNPRNTFRVSFTGSYSIDETRRFRLTSDLEKYQANQTDDETYLNPPRQASERITFEPRVSYTFSTRVSADMFVRYRHVNTIGSRSPSTTTIDGGFNVRVNVSN